MARELHRATVVSGQCPPGLGDWGAGASPGFQGREGTHGDEHDDREGVVHGVSAHGPPRQPDHLRAEGRQLLWAGETGVGVAGWAQQLGGFPTTSDPLPPACSYKDMPMELLVTQPETHSPG